MKLISHNLPAYNACRGSFTCETDGKEWYFPKGSLHSGGSVSFDENWSETVEEGPWTINEWPKGFPEDKKWEVLDLINEEFPWGCCGGCV